MAISLPTDQIRWLEAEVSAGRFASIDEAVRSAIAALMQDGGDDDLDWAKPLVDEALAEVERGEGLPAEQVRAELDCYLKSLGAR